MTAVDVATATLEHRTNCLCLKAARRLDTPHPCPGALGGYLFTKGYCIEIVVRNLMH